MLAHAIGGPLDGPAPLPLGDGNLIGRALNSPAASPDKWLVLDGNKLITPGSAVKDDWEVVRLGTKGVARVPSGDIVFIHLVSGQAPDSRSSNDLVLDAKLIALERSRADPRVLPVTHDSLGKRHLDFKEACDNSAPSKGNDFPIQGPLSCLWLMRHMYTNGGSPTNFHQRLMTDTEMMPQMAR